MKNDIWRALIGIMFLFTIQLQGYAGEGGYQSLVFKSSSILTDLPNKDIQSVYQDRDGYIWLSTRNGLFQYDGYSITTYKSNLTHPDLLTNNNVFCTTEDTKQRLWIGTYSGLSVLDKKTGIIRKINHPEINVYGIPQILVTKDERILLATDWGLFEYIEETDDFICLKEEMTGHVLPQTTIKTLFEDHLGDIWIGTWNQGLFRYEHKTGKYHRYPQLNPLNSAHYIYQDYRKNIWVGTWGGGLLLLKDAYQPEKTTWTTFRYHENNPDGISDDIVYAISEDINTHSLWVGTRKGLSVLPPAKEYTGNETFYNYYPTESDRAIASDEVATIMQDRQGLMWVGMIGGGVNTVNTRKPDFNWDELAQAKRMLKTTSVRSMLVDDEGLLWLGLGSNGLATKNRQTGEFTYYTQIPGFEPYKRMSTVMSMMQHSVTGHIWIAVYDGGVYEVNKKAPVSERVKNYTPQNVSWLPGSCVFHVYEDSRHNLWFATRNGVSMRKANGEAVRLDTLRVDGNIMWNVHTMHLTEGANGDIWVASNTYGVLRLHAGANNQYTVSTYSTHNGKLNSIYADCIYKDSKGRIWVGTGGSGLSLYEEDSDSFLPIHARWNLPGDAIVSIQSDREENLWIGTNAGLIKLAVTDNPQQTSFRLYTTVDGLQDNIFIRNSMTRAADGEMLFGGHKGYNSFYPEKLQEQSGSAPVRVTDIKIFNQSWSSLPPGERTKVSPLSPGFTREIVLDHRHNNFSIEFSAMEYANPGKNHYAYKLTGFESEWQYTGGSKHFAYYNNLQPGVYTFHLKSSNANGIWNQEALRMKVTILPPPWKTWWAYTLYIIGVLILIYYTYRIIRNRIRLRNALQLSEIEQAKAEEVNHAKLQFFTNITHELLTPLTIISASVDELKRLAPVYKEQYQVMSANINRLIRLLQQILEFRKAETGNLQLRVGHGDLARFVSHNLNSFLPLMKKKDIQFSIACSAPTFNAYFDPDKLDKILYNLLSNASKYNRPGGSVSVELTKEGDMARLVVKDTGPGLSAEAQKNLFKRFNEGDYRKFKTIGTGIGLSLVRDLVLLHHGSISVESEEGKGTVFVIRLPYLREAYPEEEIEDGIVITDIKTESVPEPLKEPDNVLNVETDDTPDTEATPEELHSILIVEDNEELLHIMTKLLKTNYVIHTATNGIEAINVIEREYIDLIVSDIMMPRMDGVELCKYIKSKLETSHIPVILLTAKTKEEDRVNAYESGADGFITKPFNLSVLHARISNLLRNRQRMGKDFRNQLVFEAKELNFTQMDEDFLQQVIDCITHHLDDPEFGQKQLLAEIGLSKSTFFRKLKSLTGLSYVSFIRNIRMKAACRMMDENNEIRITDLADAVGYNDPRYFCNSFVKEFGIHPTEYMERYTSKG